MRFMCSCPSTCGFCKTFSGTVSEAKHSRLKGMLMIHNIHDQAKANCSVLLIVNFADLQVRTVVAMLFLYMFTFMI